jgi:hypothetical protein
MFKHTCTHYTGGLDDLRCEAGVEYASVTPHPNAKGSAYRKPCILWDKTGRPMSEFQKQEWSKRGHCPKFKLPTEQETAEFEVQTTNLIMRLNKAQPLISQVQREHKGECWQGVFDCPACGASQSLVLGVASNGHTHGRCKSGGGECLNWID